MKLNSLNCLVESGIPYEVITARGSSKFNFQRKKDSFGRTDLFGIQRFSKVGFFHN